MLIFRGCITFQHSHLWSVDLRDLPRDVSGVRISNATMREVALVRKTVWGMERLGKSERHIKFYLSVSPQKSVK